MELSKQEMELWLISLAMLGALALLHTTAYKGKGKPSYGKKLQDILQERKDPIF